MAEESRLKSRSTPVTLVLTAADGDRLSVLEETPSSARRPEPAPICSPPSTRWYREPYVWLLMSIPAATVLAGLITLALAIASDGTAPGAPAQGATSSHATG